MNEDIFGGISIDQLKEITPDNSSTITVEKEIVKAKQKEESKEEEIIDEGIDISELANIEADNKTEEEDDKKVKKPVDVGTSSVTNNLLKTLASNLQKTGILSEITDEELDDLKDEEQLYSLIGKQVKANEFKSLNEDQKLLLEALENGIPEEDFLNNRRSSNYFKSITDEQISEDINLAADLIYKSFKIRGFTDAEAKKYAISAAKSEDATETAIMAKEAIVKYNDDILLKEIESNKAKELQRAKQKAEKIETIKSKINNSNDIIKDITINQQTKDKIFTSITKPVGVDEDGVPLNEVLDKYAKDTDFQVRLHLLYTITKGFTDFSKLQQEIKTKATKSLKEEFHTITNGGNNSTFTGLDAKKIASLIPNF